MTARTVPKFNKAPKVHWWPFRPKLRMIARILGIVLLTAGVYQTYETHHSQIGLLAMPLVFIFWSFIPPERRS